MFNVEHSAQVTTNLLTRGGKDIAFSDYSPLWRFHRRLVHNSFTLFGEGTSRLQDIGTVRIHRVSHLNDGKNKLQESQRLTLTIPSLWKVCQVGK